MLIFKVVLFPPPLKYQTPFWELLQGADLTLALLFLFLRKLKGLRGLAKGIFIGFLRQVCFSKVTNLYLYRDVYLDMNI